MLAATATVATRAARPRLPQPGWRGRRFRPGTHPFGWIVIVQFPFAITSILYVPGST